MPSPLISHLTLGINNTIVCDHPDMCHHCGFLSKGTLDTCVSCGVRAHAACVPFVDHACDACRLDLHAEVCAICHRADDGVTCDAQRLVKCIAFHGFEWTECDDATRPNAVFHMTASHEVPRRLAHDVGARFTAEQLPNGGSVPMSVTLENGRRMFSRPLVVHSWCAQCAFQQTLPEERPPTRDASFWTPTIDNLCNPVHQEFATTEMYDTTAVVSDVPCTFCDDSKGHKTFCLAHMNSCSGCDTCRWDMRKNISLHCFHPSCAVRAGMRRVARSGPGGSGMMCIKSSKGLIDKTNPIDRRARSQTVLMSRVLQWMEACSGINVDLLEVVDPMSISKVCAPMQRMGALHVDPLARRDPPAPRLRAPGGHKKKTSKEHEGDQETAHRTDEGDDEDGPQHATHDVDRLSSLSSEQMAMVRRLVKEEVRRARTTTDRFARELIVREVGAQLEEIHNKLNWILAKLSPNSSIVAEEVRDSLHYDLQCFAERLMRSMSGALTDAREGA